MFFFGSMSLMILYAYKFRFRSSVFRARIVFLDADFSGDWPKLQNCWNLIGSLLFVLTMLALAKISISSFSFF